MEAAETPQRSHRLRNWAIGLVAAYAIHVVLLGVITPRVAHEPLRNLVGGAFSGEVDFEELSFNPFTLVIEARGFSLHDGEGRLVASAERVSADVEFWASLLGIVEIRALQIDSPTVHVEIDEDGRLNVLDLLAQEDEEAPPEETGLFRFRVAHAKVSAGRITFVDRARAHSFEASIIPLELTLAGFSSVSGEGGLLHLEASGDRGSHLSADFTLLLDPPSATGQIHLSGVRHALLADYFGLDSSLRPVSGEFALQGGFRVAFSGADVVLEIDEGRVDADGWAIESDLAPIASFGFERFGITGFRLALAEKSVHIDEITLDAPRLAAVLPDESTHATPDEDNSSAYSEADWTVAVGRIAVSQGHVTVAQAGERETPFFHLGPLSLEIQDISYEAERPIKLDLKLGLPEVSGQSAEPGGQGLVRVQGEITVSPMSARLEVEAKNVALAPFGELMGLAPGVRVESGTLDATSMIEASVPKDEAPRISASTDLALRDLRIVDSRHAANGNGREREVLGLGLLELRRLRLRENGSRLELAGLRLVGPRLRIEHDANGELNLLGLLERDESAQGLGETDGSGTAVDLRRIQIEDGHIKYSDATTTRTFALEIDQIAGEIERKVSGNGRSEGVIRLEGKVDGIAPITLDGTFPSTRQITFRMRVDGLVMIRLSPYFEQYVGRGVEQGKLYLDLGYDVDDQTVRGRNQVRFDRLVFGPRTNSPDRLNLPIPLAFTLMTDLQGQTRFDLDIEGRLDDPGFSPRSLIAEAFIKVIQQSLSSPLAVLQTVIPDLTQDEQLRFNFAPGKFELGLEQETQLGALASVLADNPKQRVRIKVHVDPKADGAALARQQGRAEGIDDETLRELGRARVRAILDELVERGAVSADRVFVRSIDMSGEAGTEGVGVEVTLTGN